MLKKIQISLIGLFLSISVCFAGGFNEDNSSHPLPGDELVNYSFPSGLKIGLSGGYYSTTSRYDLDGNTNDFFNGGKESEFNGRFKLSYRFPCGNSCWGEPIKYKLGTEFTYLNRNYTQDAGNQAPAVDQSGSGLQSVYFKGSVSSGNVFNSSLGAKLHVGYQLDTGPDPEPNELEISDRQNALLTGLDIKYVTPKFNGFVGTDYALTFARTQNDKDFDIGDYFSVNGGGYYKYQFDSGAQIKTGIELVYIAKSESSFDGNNIPNSENNLLSLNPFVSLNYQNWGVSLGGYAYDEYRLKRGVIPLSGKNVNKPSIVGTIRTTFRF